MELKLQLGVFMLLVHVSSALLQRVTVKNGHTVRLSCPVSNTHLAQVEWRNPDHNIMFFGQIKGEESSRDKRYTIIKLSESDFTVSISNVTFKDGGSYTCSQYSRHTGQHTTVKVVEVTVIGHPKMSVAGHNGKSVVQCRAEATHHAPQISWRLNNGPEIQAFNDVHQEEKIFVSMDQMTINPLKKTVTVKCLVRHPALHSQTLMIFEKIGQKAARPPYFAPTSAPSARPAEPTEGPRTTSRSTPAKMTRTSSYPVTGNTVTPTGSPQSTTDNSRTSDSSLSTRGNNDTDRNATGTTGWTSVSMTTETIPSYNQTGGNKTVGSKNHKMEKESGGSSSLLVFLVTCLIVCLLVVVIFFTIKLRRAHLAWKRENEDSDPSEESNRSRSSQEERNAQGQRRRGIFNTAFTQYVTEKPSTITSVVNTAAIETVRTVPNMAQTASPVTPGQTTAPGGIKETEL